ncbi:hypothetical protein R3P38DRAFT_3371958 [Favolaschia claudopus]|uniref:Uncharacterized protein n=1 Tax=Favolaschia claudopus TaxID=2862362 RepID=A0AAV9ZVG8_9AGAR
MHLSIQISPSTRSLYVSTSRERDFRSFFPQNLAAGRLIPPPTRKATSSPDPRRSTFASWSLLPPPRREAARMALTIRIAFPRATAFALRLWLPAGKSPPPTPQRREAALMPFFPLTIFWSLTTKLIDIGYRMRMSFRRATSLCSCSEFSSPAARGTSSSATMESLSLRLYRFFSFRCAAHITSQSVVTGYFSSAAPHLPFHKSPFSKDFNAAFTNLDALKVFRTQKGLQNYEGIEDPRHARFPAVSRVQKSKNSPAEAG